MIERVGSISQAALCLSLLALAACGRSPGQDARQASAGSTVNMPAVDHRDATPVPAPANMAASGNAVATAGTMPVSCAADLGAAAADRLAKTCRDVSPATRPPCNAANSCAMIEDEIARSCALFDGQGAPMPGCTPAPKSMAAAAAVVQRYYAAINAHDYDTAWQQWGDDGPPGQSRSAFEAGFAHTRSTRVTIGALQPGDGGAGSIYQPVPVTVDATLDDGTQQHFRGDYVVRRVNDVDGASPGQLRWHIGSAHLKPAPAS